MHQQMSFPENFDFSFSCIQDTKEQQQQHHFHKSSPSTIQLQMPLQWPTLPPSSSPPPATTNQSNEEPEGFFGRVDPCKVLNTFGSKKAKTLLPMDFQPSRYTVLVGRTRECQTAPGNKRLRAIVSDHVQAYNSAPDKIEKTAIVTQVYNAVRTATPIGHFVKLEKGRYYEVGERTARERIGAMFRDNLHQKYRSSAKNKVAARMQKAKTNTAIVNEADSIIMTFGKDWSSHSFFEEDFSGELEHFSGEFEDFSDIFD